MGEKPIIAEMLMDAITGNRKFAQAASDMTTGPEKLLRAVVRDWELTNADAQKLLALQGDQMKAVLKSAATIDRLFRDRFAVYGWLREPVDKLHGRSPLQVMCDDTDEGPLKVGEYTEYLAGR